MLNLSDKELDRLSREAATEHDPGDLLGPGAWDKLAWRLDQELGKNAPNPARGARRFPRSPLYYAPAIMLLIGVSYFIFKGANGHGRSAASGSPPATAVNKQPSVPTENKLSNNQINAYKSTSTPDQDLDNPAAGTPETNRTAGNSTATGSATANSIPGNAAASSNNTGTGSTGNAGSIGNNTNAGTTANNNSTRAPADNAGAGSTHLAASRPAGHTHTPPAAPSATHETPGNSLDVTGLRTHPTASNSNELHSNGLRTTGLRRTRSQSAHRKPAGAQSANGQSTQANDILSSENAIAAAQTGSASPQPGSAPQTGRASLAPPHTVREPAYAFPPASAQLNRRPTVSDSLLRAFAGIEGPIHPDKNNGRSLHINRSLQIGAIIAPDFSSVGALAGDKPGSSLGLTLDYQFANRWYIGTGLLYSRKNYTARSADFHAPYNSYAINIHDVQFIKGSLHMLEIPLNLRYDFSVVGNTLFYASTGISSYLLASENSKYYFDYFGQTNCLPFKAKNGNSYLCTAINLSIGVETGISNSLSMSIAPYMKLPIGGGVGLGQVQMSSVGLTFGLKYAPVINRKRK